MSSARETEYNQIHSEKREIEGEKEIEKRISL